MSLFPRTLQQQSLDGKPTVRVRGFAIADVLGEGFELLTLEGLCIVEAVFSMIRESWTPVIRIRMAASGVMSMTSSGSSICNYFRFYCSYRIPENWSCILSHNMEKAHNTPPCCANWSENPVPACKNCGEVVTQQYVRVFAPDELETVRVCPSCEDKLRDGAEVREAQRPRSTNG